MIGDISSNMVMPVSAAKPLMQPLAPEAKSFSDVLASKTGIDEAKIAKEESKKLVAEAFITPILAKIRATNKAAPPFGTTTAEERFGPMFDRIIADGMTRPESFPLVDAVEQAILKRAGVQQGGGR